MAQPSHPETTPVAPLPAKPGRSGWAGAEETDAPPRPAAGLRPRATRGIRLGPWHRRMVVATAAGLALTGGAWMAAQLGLDLFPELDGSATRARLHAVLMLHGVLGYAGAVLVGSLLAQHVPTGLLSGRRRTSGLATLTLVGGLVVTALLLYYAGSETVRDASSVAHQALGAIAVAGVWIHVAGRERPRGRPSRRSGPRS